MSLKKPKQYNSKRVQISVANVAELFLMLVYSQRQKLIICHLTVLKWRLLRIVWKTVGFTKYLTRFNTEQDVVFTFGVPLKGKQRQFVKKKIVTKLTDEYNNLEVYVI